MGIRDRIRAWGAVPDLPILAEGERLLLDASGRRLPIGLARKTDYSGYGRLGFTDRRLVYLARHAPRENLGNVRLAWDQVESATLHRGPGKLLRAPRPYVALFGAARPMFTLATSAGDEFRFQLFASEGWQAAIIQLRILYPSLARLGDR